MKCHLTEIPGEPADQAVWLERKLVGFELGELVEDLKVLSEFQADTPARPRSLESILGADRQATLDRGLKALAEPQLQMLFAAPDCLLELQELLLLKGGPYWERLLSESVAAVEMDATFDESSRQRDVAPRQTIRPEAAATRRRRPLWGMLLAVAAAIVLIVWLRPVGANWGWLSEDALAAAPPRVYLLRLADGGDAWFTQRPTSRRRVARRLDELIDGCQRLIASSHTSLHPEDAAWLKDRCRDWKVKLETAATSLESGDPLAVRADVDEIVHQLVAKLQERAELAKQRSA